jgi:hypothetical protein
MKNKLAGVLGKCDKNALSFRYIYFLHFGEQHLSITGLFILSFIKKIHRLISRQLAYYRDYN